MPRTPDNPTIKIFGAALLLHNLNAIMQEVEGVRTSRDIEYVHRMRVATRRLRSGIDLFGPLLYSKRSPGWLKNVRSLTGALGKARDTDVQIALVNVTLKSLQSPQRSGVHRLLLRLRQRRVRYQANVLGALKKFERSHTANDMVQKLAPLDFYKNYINPQNPGLQQIAYDNIQANLTDFFSYEEAVQDPNNIAELHAMRIAAKHLRYTMEFFTGIYPDELKSPLKMLRTCQDLLGSIHDNDVWIDWLPRFILKERQRTIIYYGSARPFAALQPGLEYFLNARKDDRARLYDQFMTTWDKWRANQEWEKLQTTLDVSLAESIMLAEQPEPPAPDGPEVLPE